MPITYENIAKHLAVYKSGGFLLEGMRGQAIGRLEVLIGDHDLDAFLTDEDAAELISIFFDNNLPKYDAFLQMSQTDSFAMFSCHIRDALLSDTMKKSHAASSNTLQFIFALWPINEDKTPEKIMHIYRIIKGLNNFSEVLKENGSDDYVKHVFFMKNPFVFVDSNLFWRVLKLLYESASSKELAIQYFCFNDPGENNNERIEVAEEKWCIQDCLRFFLDDPNFDVDSIKDMMANINFKPILLNCVVLHAYLSASISDCLSTIAMSIIKKTLPHNHRSLNYIIEGLFQHSKLMLGSRRKLCQYLDEILDDLLQDKKNSAEYFSELFNNDFSNTDFGALYLLIKLFEIEQKVLHKTKKETAYSLNLWEVLEASELFRGGSDRVLANVCAVLEKNYNSLEACIATAINVKSLAKTLCEYACDNPINKSAVSPQRSRCSFYIPAVRVESEEMRQAREEATARLKVLKTRLL